MQGLEPLEQTITNWAKSQTKTELEACPVCGELILKQRNDIRRPIGDMHLVQCIQCGFLTYDPQPDYSKYYAKQVRAQNVKFLTTKANKLNYHRKQLLSFLKTEKEQYPALLDYGCSDGYFMKLFLDEYEYAYKAKGIELNPGHANWGKYVDGLDITTDADLDNIEESYNVISLFHVLEHVQNPGQFIASLLEKLDKGGLLYVAVPTLSRVEYKSKMELFKDEHINLFTDELLEKFLTQFGLTKVYENKELYGTCFIMRYTNHSDLVLYKGDFEKNNKVVEDINQCFEFLDKFDELKMHNPNQAILAARQGLDIFDNFIEFIKQPAALMDPIDTIEWFKEWIEKKPNLLELHLALGHAYFVDKELESAKEQLLIHKEKFGYHPVTNSFLAQTEYYLGNTLEAVKLFKESLDHNPTALENVEFMGSILKDL